MPMTTKLDSTAIEARMASRYRESGLPCEIEAGPLGLVVYALNRFNAEAIAKDILRQVRERDPRAIASKPMHDMDEPAATSWWAAVEFDWRRFG